MGKGFDKFSKEWLTTTRPKEAEQLLEKGKEKERSFATGQETKPSKGKNFIEALLKLSGINYEKEYQFYPPRKFRFDFAFWHRTNKGVNINVAIEYEGIFSGKSRHTTFSGYTNDSTKYNIASLNGWIVLRYTAKNYKNFTEDLQKLLT